MTFRDLAARYADDGDADRLAELVEQRLQARLRRAGTACVVCGRLFVSAHRDAVLCGREVCKKRHQRARNVP